MAGCKRRGVIMDFSYSPKVERLRKELVAFMDQVVYPNERRFFRGARGKPSAKDTFAMASSSEMIS
jgi:hypothetical protein